MNAGWSFDQFKQVTGFDLQLGWQTEIKELVSKRWAIANPERFRLTSQGLRFADSVAEMFLR